MKVTYDRAADAAYISLEAESSAVAETDSLMVHDVNVDFDHEGKITGIEIGNASQLLSDAFLAAASQA